MTPCPGRSYILLSLPNGTRDKLERDLTDKGWRAVFRKVNGNVHFDSTRDKENQTHENWRISIVQLWFSAYLLRHFKNKINLFVFLVSKFNFFYFDRTLIWTVKLNRATWAKFCVFFSKIAVRWTLSKLCVFFCVDGKTVQFSLSENSLPAQYGNELLFRKESSFIYGYSVCVNGVE